jgi:hypothetical protein
MVNAFALTSYKIRSQERLCSIAWPIDLHFFLYLLFNDTLSNAD